MKKERNRKANTFDNEKENKTSEDMPLEEKNSIFEEKVYYDIMETEKAVGK